MTEDRIAGLRKLVDMVAGGHSLRSSMEDSDELRADMAKAAPERDRPDDDD